MSQVIESSHETIRYSVDGQTFIGHLELPSTSTMHRPPVILVAHAWRGQDDFARNKAKEMVQLGYAGFAIDMYGEQKEVSNEDALEWMLPLFKDRNLLQKRAKAAYEAICQHPKVNTSSIGAIGFCFGGLTVIELLRSGVNLQGVVSFHGVLGNKIGEHQATPVPIAPQVKGALLILHGHDDPMVSSEDIQAIQKEMTKAQVDWQMHIYGHTGHAFTNPLATDKKSGLFYNPKAEQRAWQAMDNFFREIL